MLPMRASRPSRIAQAFELTTPAGRVYQYPRPTLLRRLFILLYSYADTAVVSAAVFGMLYFAGALAESLESVASDSCQN